MQNDPLAEWQRLTETYSQMYDDELLELAADSGDLTEGARQVLRSEMSKRQLETPRAGAEELKHLDRPRAGSNSPADVHFEPVRYRYAPKSQTEETGLPHEYTWKTALCECNDREHAWQVSQALSRAGIESWIERPGGDWMIGGPRVLVAADQLDEARRIAAQPIPQEIVELSKIDVPEFEPPSCPQCGAADPVLEGVDPFNTWRCEACGKQWTESAPGLDGSPENPAS